MPIPYAPADTFVFQGTTYTIKTVTPNALEIASHPEQSLWVAIAELERLLNIKGRAGLFHWHLAQRAAEHGR